MSLLQHLTFFTTVNHIRDLPAPGLVEIAFAGRSNAGKSSAINTLANRTRLAFVSKTPGRTQHINFFNLGDKAFLIDLPGYGYAKVPPAIRKHWETLLSTYLQTRESLHGLILIMDIRRPLTNLDMQMLNWFTPTGKPVHILLTKRDKLNRQQTNATLREVKTALEAYPNCTVQVFSSSSREGAKEAEALIESWVSGEIENKKPPVKGE